MRLTRRQVLKGAGALCASALGSFPAGASVAFPSGGVNLAGAEFGSIPGVHGREYLYPPAAEFGYFRNLGFSLIRLPFRWERLQPYPDAAFAQSEQRLLVETVRYATRNGQSLILDPHNFAKRRLADDGWSSEHRIGSAEVPISAFADFWLRLAALFKDDERVFFGLMNEPVGIAIDDWLQCANAAIAAIRQTGAKNLILVPGIEYTGAHSWHRLGNIAMGNVVDPLDHFAFEVHQYFDGDSSGTKPNAVSGTIGSERIATFQEWAREHGFKALLGEFNGGRNATAYRALNDLCQEMTANPDVWLGWTAWAGGPRWPEDEMFNLEPWHDGRIREQTAILAKYARPSSPSFWVADGAVVDLDLARNRFYGMDQPVHREAATFGAPEALLTLLRASAFTLAVEIHEPEASSAGWDLAQADGAPLLQRTASGAVAVFGSLQTAVPVSYDRQTRRRIALTVDHPTGQLLVGVTGAPSVRGEMPQVQMNEVTFALTSSAGRIRRITGYSRFSAASDLDALCA
jgi:endoglucanase